MSIQFLQVLPSQKPSFANVNCPICLDPLINPNEPLDILMTHIANKTFHTFHQTCLEEAYKNKVECPLCRGKPPLLDRVSLEMQRLWNNKSRPSLQQGMLMTLIFLGMIFGKKMGGLPVLMISSSPRLLRELSDRGR